jgi:NAD(P)-dependent dehydrogenase (short-subunit alcohol dehydrogenase family)
MSASNDVDNTAAGLPSFRLDGQVIVLTGASSGLGARFARVLDGLGATVIMAARRLDRLEMLASELQRAEAAVCDVAVPGAQEALVASVFAKHGKISGVIANAGITNTIPAWKESRDDFDRVISIDLVAPYELARAAAFAMKSTGGSIVMVASAAGLGSTPLLPQAGYVAAKTGLIGLTRELAMQWGRYGIRVNALCPGMFPSEMTVELTGPGGDEIKAMFESALPMRRVGQEHELDGALAFLLSQASTYMTGQILAIDGGASTS